MQQQGKRIRITLRLGRIAGDTVDVQQVVLHPDHRSGQADLGGGGHRRAAAVVQQPGHVQVGQFGGRLGDAEGGIERRRRRTPGGDGEEGHHQGGAVRRHQTDPVPRGHAESGQPASGRIERALERGVTKGGPGLGHDQGGMVVGP